MAHFIVRDPIPLKAASAISQYVPVAGLPAASALSETVIRAGSINVPVVGMAIASAASPGDAVAVVCGWDEQAKGIAAASLGAFSLVAVGSTNGHLVPVSASGVASPASTGEARWIVGMALKNAVDGDVFPVLLRPSQII